ncbi:MDR family MFS transporter [Nocardia sp. NPDC004068]|uniref:MDR family MFS transporter n=1 Tax=Nocardia sp. NPDC004068 TaxID=3364303 RepID=UPI0036847AEC
MLIVGVIAVVFDTTIVGVALRTLTVELRTAVGTIQWVTTGYLLALALVVPLSIWGLRRFGGKRLWLFSLGLFLVGSIGASLAWNAESLIAWRVVQGAGGGLMLPVMSTLVIRAAGGKALGRTVTVITLPVLLGPILGPLVGGVILTQLSWRFMFWVNVPFCVAGLILAALFLPRDETDSAPGTFDMIGFVLLGPGIVALILGLSAAGRENGFGHADALAPILVGAALVLAFAGYAVRRADPLVDIRLFARRSVASACAVMFCSGFALYGAVLLLPLFYQQVRGVDALGAGVLLIPQGVGTLLSRGLTGSLTDRIGARPIAVGGFVIVTLSTIPFAYADAHTSGGLLALWLVARGFGLSAVMIPVMAVAYEGLDPARIAHASVLTRVVQQLGGSFGTAVLAVVLERAVAGRHGDVGAAFGIAFWWAVGFGVLATVLSLWLPGRRGRNP